MNLKDYSKKNIHNKTQSPNQEDLEKISQNYSGLVDEFMKRYGKMSEKQMIDEMFELISQKKKEGSFNINQIKNIAEKVKPFLSEEQQSYMMELLEKIE